ncbi:MAG: hypothetical protein FJZ66_07225 [Bacteroidetes bacterium]|nr:hypothetical protein [Bacteroidota bacterium]
MSCLRTSSLLITLSFFAFKGFSQQPVDRLINVRLVGINSKPNVADISRVEEYYKPAGIRLKIFSQEKLKVDLLKIPRLTESEEPNFLMLSLIESYQSNHQTDSSNTLTIFCLPTFTKSPNFRSFPSFGFAFYDSCIKGDNLILACTAGSLGIDHEPGSSPCITDSSAINKLRLSNVIYSMDYWAYKSHEESGLTAYYLWEEDENGNIRYDSLNPLEHIKRVEKQNYGIKYLNHDNWFFKPFTIIKDIKICPAHISVLILTLAALFIVFRIIKRFSKNKNWSIKIGAWMMRILVLVFSIFACGFNFYLINNYYNKYYVLETKIDEFSSAIDTSSIMSKIQDKLLFENDTTLTLGSQIFKKRKDEWYIQREEPVLIFQVDHQNKLSFRKGTSKLTFRNETLVQHVLNHYVKIERINEKNEVISERIFNFMGKEIYSTEFSNEKPGRRVVLFVNGYRSPFLSVDQFSRSVMLGRILRNKIEIEQTNDKIYRFDIHDYWNKWDRFDERFISKLQPSRVFYADGHHPIKTSNYGITKIPFNISLINNLGDLSYFYFAALNYPLVCADLNNHSCQYVSLSNVGEKKTRELLPSEVNYPGFEARRKSGVIAGKNLAQLMINNNSQSKDTLYIVCHSMGFAYSQGIVDAIRGKINFGGYYIFTPENPSAGRVNPNEWKEVWHYGSNENIEECLQDGIAPQSAIKGLERNRVYFPKSLYPNLGFTGSHFIGNLTWVFDLKNSQQGYITPR